MSPVYLSGRGLACALGLDIAQALATIRLGGVSCAPFPLPGALADSYPFYAIPDNEDNWDERARSLIQRVAAEAGAQNIRHGALFIATSSLDIGAIEQGMTEMSRYSRFANKVAAWLDWSGPVYVINTACSSSMNALIAAHSWLRAGATDEALVLGLELDNRLTLSGFAALQLLSATGSKPFGLHRDGMVLGEAVAALRLSTRASAQWRLLGGANVVNGEQPTGASAGAVRNMCQRALAASGVNISEIDLVKVQAAGGISNDAVEAQGLRAVFPAMPALISLKAALGHTMGASGAAEIALLMSCLEQDVWPKYGGEVDAALGVVLADSAPGKVRKVLASILGFGGSHAAVILERA